MATNNTDKIKIPLIGLLAVKNLLITKEELQKGLSNCPDSKTLDAFLKEYLISNELVSSRNMERLLRAAKTLEMRQKEFKFGAIAIRKGFISQSVLKLALEEQGNTIKNKGKFRLIGDLLVEAGMLTEKQRDYILKLQKRVRQEIKKTSRKKVNEKVLDDGKITTETDSGKAPHELPKDENPSGEISSKLLKPEIIDGGIKLEISEDFMAAFLTKTDRFDRNITVAQIKETLFEKGIIFGVVVDQMVEGFINSSGFKTKSFRIAKGVLPIQGKDAKVEFFFNTDYLKAGGLSIDGAIDFKDRGEIPHVEEETVLAEKIPMVESREGQNIYGDKIETIPGSDIALKFGKGAKLSADGFKVLAAVNGFPKYAMSGHIFVHEEYIAQGDVDYETGHINYDGNVNIKGRIKSGFKVKGNDIAAIELDGGIVDADGDVKIAGGINEGKIYARGNVYAKFILKSEVVCMGDVIIEKEIVDADVECSGTCFVQNGKLISSRITAKMGVKAKNIGTEMGGASTIKVAYDAFTDRELAKNKDRADNIKKQIEHHLEKKESLTQDNLILQKQITDLAHVQDRSQLEEREINSKISLIEKDPKNTESVKELKEKMGQLKLDSQTAEKRLDLCFDESETLEETIRNEENEIKKLELQFQDFSEERANLITWAKDNPGKAVVIVEGAIMPETIIRGKHCEKRVTEMIRHSKILEVLCTSDEGQSLNIYEMQVGDI